MQQLAERLFILAEQKAELPQPLGRLRDIGDG